MSDLVTASSLPKPVESFEAQKSALGLENIGMTPIEDVRELDFIPVEDIPEQHRVHPRFLTSLVLPQQVDNGHRVAYGMMEFNTREPSVNDRARHLIPHVSAPDTEHACANLLRANADGLDLVAPVLKLTMKHHLRIVPIEKPVLVELHDVKRGKLEEAPRFKSVGSMLFFIRDAEEGEPMAEVIFHYRDISPGEATQPA
ncbi:MAG TPA: hypothetical protein VFK11_03470 [Candidatus Saccharimonadales bacterium]|nr:hypothetical protein [Candidatus Saccharimonadales bacterium]